MKFRNNLKRFFTLDRHHAEGFTLVELIVVIAILAILAGVAVPAYSGYVTRTNKQADITLVSDIQYALTLAGYNGTFADGESGYLILTVDGIDNEIEADSNLDKALIAAFGSNYANTLKLKYNNWMNNGLALGLMGEKAKDVYNSTYYQSSDKLMQQVTDITNAAWNLINDTTEGEASREQMIAMFSGDNVSYSIEQAALDYGYDSIDDVPTEALPNLMVLTVASDIGLGGFAQEEGEEWQTSEATTLIQAFAQFNGYASTAAGQAPGADGKSFADSYNEFIANISNTNDVGDIAQAYKDLRDAAGADAGYAAYSSSEQKNIDMNAFNAMMSGLTGAALADPEGMAAGLSSASFFTDGLGNDLFSSYINAVEAAAGLDADACDALIYLADAGIPAVAVYYTFNTTTSVGNTMPVA